MDTCRSKPPGNGSKNTCPQVSTFAAFDVYGTKENQAWLNDNIRPISLMLYLCLHRRIGPFMLMY
jgi:hypothetical protein